jgi:hypothetical protein
MLPEFFSLRAAQIENIDPHKLCGCATIRPMHSHILIIGGTGMLKEASIALASTTTTLSSVARTKRSLSALDAALGDIKVTRHQLQLDWSNPSDFTHSLSAHIQRVGAPSLVVAWLHDDDLGIEVARCCSSAATQCDFFQVRGSAAASPNASASSFSQAFEAIPGINFHQIILGFKRTPTGSRWLSNAEISAGVLQAVKEAASLSIVGVVEPWDAAP